MGLKSEKKKLSKLMEMKTQTASELKLRIVYLTHFSRLYFFSFDIFTCFHQFKCIHTFRNVKQKYSGETKLIGNKQNKTPKSLPDRREKIRFTISLHRAEQGERKKKFRKRICRSQNTCLYKYYILFFVWERNQNH